MLARASLILAIPALVFGCSDDDSNPAVPTAPRADAGSESDAGANGDAAHHDGSEEPPDGPVGCAPDCGEHASCVTDGDEAACACDDGFIGDGVLCEPEGSWERHTIGSQDHAIYVFSVDMDDDGDLDVVATSSDHQASYASEVAWYRNDGAAEAWEKIVVDEADQDAVHACNGVFAVNLDDDAALELVVVSGPAMGSATTGVYLFDAVDGDTSNWVKRTLYENDDQTFFKVYAFDVNDDGALDLVASGASRSLLLVNPGDGSTDWEPHPMADGTGGCIIPGDVDGDGRTDVVHANLMADKISWTRIGWQGSAPVFEDTTICTTFPRPFDVNLLDVDEDGHLDVVASKIFGAGLRWFESPAADGDTWTEHVITDDLPAADLFVGDIDGDGSEDLLVAGLSMMGPAVPDSVVWFERYDDAGAVGWRKHWVDFGEPQTPGDVELQDLDGDGDLDVVTTWMTGHAVVWYENLIAVP